MADSKSKGSHGGRVVWRVTAPAAGNDEGDTTLVETPSEAAARNSYERLRASSWPVRLERVKCGPRQWREILHRRGPEPMSPECAPQ